MAVIIDVECSRCNGTGEVLGGTRNARSRYVGHDDICPGDFGEACPRCLGSGVVDYCPDDEIEDWMDSSPRGQGGE